MKGNQQSVSEFPACERAEGKLKIPASLPGTQGAKKGAWSVTHTSSTYAHTFLGDFLEPWHFWNILWPS